MFSLLNKAAEMIADGATCVRRHFYEPADGPTITTEQQAEEQPKKPEKQKKKRSFFGQIRDKFDELLTEEGRDD